MEVDNKQERHDEYEEAIKQEAKYYDSTDDIILQSGRIPVWLDYQKGEYIPSQHKQFREINRTRLDPKIQKILIGKELDFLIEKGSEKKGRALEIGCGLGWLSLELARRGIHIDAFDIGEKRLEQARKYFQSCLKYENIPGSIEHHCQDLNRITLNRRYTTAVVKDSLHHIMELDYLMRELHESLENGGSLIYFDHIGLDKRLTTLLKLPGGISRFVKRRPTIARHKNDMPLPISPFDGVSQEEMINLTAKYFEIKKLKTTMAFSNWIVNRLEVYRWPNSFKIPFCHLLKFLDSLSIKMRIFRGSSILVYAFKRD